MSVRISILLTLLTLSIDLVAGDNVPAVAKSPIGTIVNDFTLDNCYGKSITLSDYDSKQAIAIVFLGTECPLAKLYGPRLSAIQDTYRAAGLQIVGINSNKQDSLTEVAAFIHRHEINFPILKDPGNRIADTLGAQRTPEVFLIDQERVVRYHGRIDDQYGVGYSRERQAKPELTLAIDELLAGKQVSLQVTDAVGCHIGRVKETKPSGTVTYNKDIASIFNARCVNCHREGEIAPFALRDYEAVLGWEDTILEVIAENRMPPWFADPAHGEFENDSRLTKEERTAIQTWVENGMPEGDASDRPDPPRFTDGWQIDPPDQIIAMDDKAFQVPAEGIVDYQRFLIDPKWDEDRYIVQAEARPDRRSVVHHILVYVIPPGGNRQDIRQVLAGYAPGAPPLQLDDGIAIKIEKGSKLLFEMHYTPNGSPQEDLSYVGVKFTDKRNVRKLLQGRLAINQRFQIPPGEANHEVKATYVSRQDENLISMSPHMHLRGKSFRYDVRYPDGKSSTLLNVPNYDFNWQLKYTLKRPLALPRGSRVTCTAVFDNSEWNLTNPDPQKTVRWGDQSFEEMMIGFMTTVPDTDF